MRFCSRLSQASPRHDRDYDLVRFQSKSLKVRWHWVCWSLHQHTRKGVCAHSTLLLRFASIQSSFAARPYWRLFVEPKQKRKDVTYCHLIKSKTSSKSLSVLSSKMWASVTKTTLHMFWNVSFVLGKGHRPALVGSTGSGKTERSASDLQNLSRLWRQHFVEWHWVVKSQAKTLLTCSQWCKMAALFEETVQFNIALGKGASY